MKVVKQKRNATASGIPDIEYISEPRPLAFADEWYEFNCGEHFWFQWRLIAFLRQMKDLGHLLDRRALVLDIGCGTGVLGRQVERETSWQVDGTDLNEKALISHSRGRGRVMYYDVLEARTPFLEHYDYIFLFDVLEHLEGPLPFLRASLKHLKIGGHLCINVPAMPQLYGRYDVVSGHYRRYDEISLRHLFQGLPADVLDVRYWGLSMVPVLYVRKLIMERIGSDNQVISRGFKPPGETIHRLLRLLMRVETRLTKRPRAGSSLLLVARKTSSM